MLSEVGLGVHGGLATGDYGTGLVVVPSSGETPIKFLLTGTVNHGFM